MSDHEWLVGLTCLVTCLLVADGVSISQLQKDVQELKRRLNEPSKRP